VSGGSSSVINGANLLSGTASVTVLSTNGLTVGTPVSGYGVLPGATIAAVNGTNRLTLSSAATSTVFGTSLTVEALLVPPVLALSPVPRTSIGATFSYQLTATGNPTNFTAEGLPRGLSLVAATGSISGIPVQSGSFVVNVAAENAFGRSAPASLLLAVDASPAKPIITSTLAATARVGRPFSYDITADGSATTFSAVPPAKSWLTFSAPNRLSGTPTSIDPVTVNLSASSILGGTGTAVLSIKVLPAVPVISSTLSMLTVAGDPFSYQISAITAPYAVINRYTEKGLPDGLKLDTAKGLITGAVTNGGTYAVTLGAENDGGEGTAVLQINAKPARPVISTTAATFINNGSIQSVPLNVSGNPTNYTLPKDGEAFYAPWLSVTAGSLTFSGAPLKVGFTKVQLTAINESGSSSAFIAVTVKSPPPVISGTVKTIVLGDSFTYLVRALNDPTSFSASGLPDGVKFDTSTGLLQGVPTEVGSFPISLTASNDIGSSTATLTLVVNQKRPVITSNLAVSGQSGKPFNYQILATGT